MIDGIFFRAVNLIKKYIKYILLILNREKFKSVFIKNNIIFLFTPD